MSWHEYLVLRGGLENQVRELERHMGGADYPLEATLARVHKLGNWLREGLPRQQKQALSLFFSRISVSLTGEKAEAEPQPWPQPFFPDLVALGGDSKCPQGTSNARLAAKPAGKQELAGKVRKLSSAHDISLSYSACVPIENQTIPSGSSAPRAR